MISKSIFSPPSLWSNVELIERCYTQTLTDLPNYQPASLDILNIEKYSILHEQIRIVVLHCNNNTLFHTISEHFHLCESSDVIECLKYLQETDIKSVFFIISGGIKSIARHLKKITMLNKIYAIYLFVEVIDDQELNDTILRYNNIGRLFDNLEFLLNCLTADIKLRFEQLLYIPSVSTFTSADNTMDKEKLHLTVEQGKFATFQFYVNTLREAPPFIHGSQQLYDRCLALAENKSDGERALKILKTDKDQVFEWFVNEPFLSLIINSFLQEQFPQNLLNIRQILMDVDQRFVDVSPTTSSAVVYRVQLLREQDLKIIQENVNELITFHTYLLTTKDLLTARSIARQAADRGLLAIIFQIKIPSHAYVLQLDNNRLMFRFGTIFRIQSIDSAPDNVWYAELKNDDSDFQSIQERLQLQIGEQLTWLTFGNYLCALNHFDEAKCYYNYLLNALPEDHQALPSIYNNIGLIFARLGDHKQALEHYKTSIDLLNKISSNANHTSESVSFKKVSQSAETMITTDCHMLYNRMSEVHLQQSQHEEALECYRKALELSPDPLLRLQYEQKIKNILSSKQ